MIIGNGMVAQALNKIDSNKFCFFASGVSTSNIDNQEEFDRERDLLKDVINKYSDSKKIIYFSSCGINFESTPYFRHKLNMEKLIRENVKEFYIFRLPQVIGNGGNKNTLFNYLIHQVKNQSKIEVWQNVKRNLIDIDDVVTIVSIVTKKDIKLNSIVDIASPYNITIEEVIKNIEMLLGIESNYTLINKGEAIDVNIKELYDLIDIDKIFCSKDFYLQKLIKKYEKEIK